MKTILLMIAASIAVSASAVGFSSSTIDAMNFDFIAPIVANKADSPKQVGLIVFDNDEQGFFGFDVNGNWVALSTPAAGSFEEDARTISPYTITANTWGDLGSVTLTPGTWEISVLATYYSNGTTTTTEIVAGIGTSSGAGGTGVITGVNTAHGTKTAASTSYDSLAVPSYRVTPATTTTYYLKGFVRTSTTNLEVASRISARKVD